MFSSTFSVRPGRVKFEDPTSAWAPTTSFVPTSELRRTPWHNPTTPRYGTTDEHAFRSGVEPDADGVVDGVRDGRNGGMERSLTGLLGSVGAFGIDGLDDERLQFRRVQAGGDPVIQQGRGVVQSCPPVIGVLEDLLLHQGFGESHIR